MSDNKFPIFFLAKTITPEFKKAFSRAGVKFQVIHPGLPEAAIELAANFQFFIVIGDYSGLAQFFGKISSIAIEPQMKKIAVIGLGTDVLELVDANRAMADNLNIQFITDDSDLKQIDCCLRNAYSFLQINLKLQTLQRQIDQQANEMRELNDIGIALSAERDPDVLLETILLKSREITLADAGSLYLIEKKEGCEEDDSDYFADKQLRFRLAQCDSVSIDFTESVMPIEKKSLAGYVALTGETLNIPDVYKLPKNSQVKHNRSFDKAVGYRTTSMLVIPMKNHKDEMIGILQLINRKKNWEVLLTSEEIIRQEVVAFDDKCVDLASSLASQAAVSIENNRLYEEIKNLFEGFIKASVHAIEQRDPTTFGHSERVATLSTALAKQVDEIHWGKFKQIQFSRDQIQQIHYAALLHDFGKIGVRENILVKEKKLFPHELESVKNRFKIYSKAKLLQTTQQKVDYLLKTDKNRALEYFNDLDNEIKQQLMKLDEFLQLIIEINEPTVLNESRREILQQIAAIAIQDNGQTSHLLTQIELSRLSIVRGSLSPEERVEIESHVNHTYNFLNRIPWTKELKVIPQIAYAHHEKLDGSGYPRGLTDAEIPIQSKMMVIADIYDALTAWDRPYKKAVPVEKALQILQYEVNEGKIDPDLFQVFVKAKLYQLVQKPA